MEPSYVSLLSYRLENRHMLSQEGFLIDDSNLHFDWKGRGFELCFEFSPDFIMKSDIYAYVGKNFQKNAVQDARDK